MINMHHINYMYIYFVTLWNNFLPDAFEHKVQFFHIALRGSIRFVNEQLLTQINNLSLGFIRLISVL